MIKQPISSVSRRLSALSALQKKKSLQKAAEKKKTDTKKSTKKEDKPLFKRAPADVREHTPVLLQEVLQGLNLKPVCLIDELD